MAIDTRSIGRVYEMACGFAESYCGEPLYRLPEMMIEMSKTNNKEVQESAANPSGPQFPQTLYKMLTDSLVKAYWNRWKELPKKDIKKIYLDVWKFHKKHLLGSLTEEALDKAVTEAGALTKNEPKEGFMTTMYYTAVMDISHRLINEEPKGA